MERKPLRQPDASRYGSVAETAAVNAKNASDSNVLDVFGNARDIERISRNLDNGNLGAAIDAFMALVSVVFAGTYIANTYIPANSMPHSIWVIEVMCASLFTVDFAFRGVYLAANRRREYLLSMTTLAYLVVILPVLPASFFTRYHTFWYGESWWRFVYPARFAMCYLTGRAVLSRCHAYLTPVRQFALLCYLQIACILLGAAGIIQIAETMDGTLSVKNLGEWTFFNSFFNSVMTFVTIDKPPSENALSKVFVGVLVCIFILVIPYQISNVMDLSNSVSAYEQASYKPSANNRHVVLCGDLTATRISHFFHEIFHNDHDFGGVHVIVLSEDPPATSLKALLLDPFFAKRVWFIQGSLLDVDDAKRAACDSADAIFMLTDRVGDEEFSVSDHRTLMRVLAAKRQAPKAHIFAQLHRSVHCQLVRDMGVQNVLCLSEVALSLLGQNCICPGFSTFMYSLTSTSSFDDDNDEGLGSDAKRTNRSKAIDNGEVFAVADGPRGKVVLNPGDTYKCVGGETAYVIAQTQADATRFERWQFDTPEPEKETEGEEKEKPPTKKSSKSVEDAVVDDVCDLGLTVAPIVVCVTTESAFANDLEHLIRPLRTQALKQYHPVVILTAKLPDDDAYDGFSHYPDVHFVVGDPYRHKTLSRAGVAEAYRILILGTSNAKSDNDSELIQDAESVALHKFITSFIGVKKAPCVITEVGNRASVHFMAQNLLANGWFPGFDGDSELTMFSSSETFSRNFFLSPAFTSGLTYSTSLCDSLLINQFFNGQIKKILGEFMFTSRASDAWAALRGDKSKPEIQGSSLFAVEVPLDFVGRSFEYVLHYLLSSDDILVLGLYRCHPYMDESKARVEVPESERSVPFGYVYVNPQPFEVITGDDLLYVLSDKQPCWVLG
uniref:RCK N-terminal domain-containing protein n=1 Tax=Phytophthora ramorum TaxID=164328 RepID=H3GXL6_PHYRM